MDEALIQRAISYWQDSLAKFFPTSKGPTTTEIDMFKAGWKRGYLEGLEDAEDLSG